MTTYFYFSFEGICQPHPDLSLANTNAPDKVSESWESAQETLRPFVGNGGNWRELYVDGTVKLKISNDAVSECPLEIFMGDSTSVSPLSCIQSVTSEKSLLEDKENLIDSFKIGSVYTGDSNDLLPQFLQDDLSPLPNDVENFSFDLHISNECDVEAHADAMWQQGYETDILFGMVKKESVDKRLVNFTVEAASCKSGIKAVRQVNDSKVQHLLPVENGNTAAQVTASIKENTGKKRGRKKIYNAGSCLEEEVYFKRARNNEACGKYRSMKKKRLEMLFDEERALNKVNSSLKAMCEQMETEKRLLTNQLLSVLKQKA